MWRSTRRGTAPARRPRGAPSTGPPARHMREASRSERPSRMGAHLRTARSKQRRVRRGPDRGLLLRGARLFLRGIGETELKRETAKTPARFAEAWGREILAGYRTDPARILASIFRSREEGMVVVRDIPFVSVCAHHLLPFLGTAHVAYIPSGRLVGLSKVARLVDALSRRLQLQERLGRQVVESLDRALRPAGVACR